MAEQNDFFSGLEGYNPNEQVQDFDAFMGSQGTDGFLDTLYGSVIQDTENRQQAQQAAFDMQSDIHNRGMQMSDFIRSQYDDFFQQKEKADQEYRGMLEDYGQKMEGFGEERSQLADAYSRNVEQIMGKGAELGRESSEEAVQVAEGLKQEIKDYETQIASGQVAGSTARMRDSVTQQQEQLRRSGAPQSAIDQVAVEAERQMSNTLQSSLGEVGQRFQQLNMQATGMLVDTLNKKAGVEFQAAGMEADAALQGFKAKAEAMSADQSLRMDFENRKLANEQQTKASNEQYKMQQMAQELVAEQFELNQMESTKQFIMNNPAIGWTATLGHILGYETMPGIDSLRSLGVQSPRTGQGVIATERLMGMDDEGYKGAFPGVDWSKTNVEDHKRMIRMRGGEYMAGAERDAARQGVSYL